MKIAYKALYNKALEEKEELLYQVDKLVEENIKMRDKVESYKAVAVITLISCVSATTFFWIFK